MTGAAVNVDVNETGGEDLIRKIMMTRAVGHDYMVPGPQSNNPFIFNDHHRMLDNLRGSQEPHCCDNGLHSFEDATRQK